MHRHAVFFFAILPALATSVCADPEKIDFARDVQPLLAKACIRCHGAKLQESNYRLDVRQVALATADRGDAPIVPGDADASPLFRFVSHTDVDGTIMPPEDEGKPLTATEGCIWFSQSHDGRSRIQCVRSTRRKRASLFPAKNLGTQAVAPDGLHDQGATRTGLRVWKL